MSIAYRPWSGECNAAQPKFSREIADSTDMKTKTAATAAVPPQQPGVNEADDPLSAGQHEELAAAVRRQRKFRGAMKLATFNAWTTGIFAALSALLAFFSVVAAALAAGLAAVSWNEFRGRRRLAKLDVRALRILGWNQFYMLGVIAGYCVWRIVTVLTQPNPYASTVQSTPELGPMLGSIGELYTRLTVAIYG
ncbi:MAG: hypothetical protein J7M14_01920, partial [Planctomycetes bacterium]|nr:hypothetical protein [Planctomycetota bacterium]